VTVDNCLGDPFVLWGVKSMKKVVWKGLGAAHAAQAWFG